MSMDLSIDGCLWSKVSDEKNRGIRQIEQEKGDGFDKMTSCSPALRTISPVTIS